MENRNSISSNDIYIGLEEIFETIGSDVQNPLNDLPIEIRERIKAQMAMDTISPND
ncbi:MAG: hypothetical protein LBP53_03005 [Candidatus Peribacteria bacterium]|jgi:hypothetical protein|nr:hypothetical protein [Candidatus Peribacteria bacterium]